MTDHDMPAVPASEAAGEAAMADWAEQAAQRKADRAESARQFRWLIGTFIALTGVPVGAMHGVGATT
ncbi:MAG: hypothetical protein OXB99_07365 [Acidimicrobiaceae bacterium]|nr:hypothetical protein [Acidimicrobiaceae bacterium]